jgi:hypothetical protein
VDVEEAGAEEPPQIDDDAVGDEPREGTAHGALWDLTGKPWTRRASKSSCIEAEGSGKKLAEDFLARLNRSCEQHGSELLDRVYAERPKLYF